MLKVLFFVQHFGRTTQKAIKMLPYVCTTKSSCKQPFKVTCNTQQLQLSQPVRLLLAYTGTEHVEKFYDMGPPPDFDKSDFHKVKVNILKKYILRGPDKLSLYFL
jgi:hypothetical protein